MAQKASSPNIDFTGRRVLVTGGGRGIGLAVVKLFSELNAEVVVFDKNDDLLEKLARDHPTVQGVKVDLADWEGIKKATEAVLPIHHLVNNAVLLETRSVLEIDEESFDRQISVNLKPVLNVSQVVAKGMIRDEVKDGTIVSMSSIADSMASVDSTMYSVAKAAVVMLTKNLALELGQYGIRVNCVRPAIVNTELIAGMPKEMSDGMKKMFFGRMALKRMVEPVEIARTVVFLSSSWASMSTGTSSTVDGGFVSSF